MARVNYVKECRAFMALAVGERLSANEFVLWHALFELFNRKAEGDEWPDGFVEISNAQLLPMTTFGVGDSGCETLRKTREKLQVRGLIKYRKGRRNALAPACCLCYFFAEKCGPAGSAETPVIMRPKGTAPGKRTGKLLGNPLGKPLGKALGKPLGKPMGKPLAKTLDIPLNVNLNPNPNPGHTQSITGRGNPPPACPMGSLAGRQPDESANIPALQGKEKGSGCAEMACDTGGSGYDLGWKTSARARGSVAQRLLDKYDGLLDTKDAWGDLCEVMADGLDPGTIERVMPTRPTFSKLIARLRALALCGEYRRFDLCSHPDSPDTDGLNAPVKLLSIGSRLPMGKDGNYCLEKPG